MGVFSTQQLDRTTGGKTSAKCRSPVANGWTSLRVLSLTYDCRYLASCPLQVKSITVPMSVYFTPSA
eukprot:scaffold6011_cov177-Skeletonema_menzelii.AAC.1